MPITDRSQAKEGGFAQVRGALQKFKGKVVKAEFGQWGGKLVDDDGKPVPPREYLEIESVEVEVLEVTEELSMDITEWNFRENCSEFKGSFWVEKFLESADKFKILVPDGLMNKVITFEKVTLEAFDKTGAPNPKYNSTNYVIVAVEGGGAITAKPKVVAKAQATAPVEVTEPEEEESTDPMEMALDLAVGKTETQFRTAIGIDPRFAGNPLVQMAKAGIITQALVNEGKLQLVKVGNKEVYTKVE
uniref:Uncharacterized protein n=2 Tax=viral metagenome TaxID=1070528 RepID=A0A6M3KAQ2_9ZZZZ